LPLRPLHLDDLDVNVRLIIRYRHQTECQL
jgi:hypothetical protein